MADAVDPPRDGGGADTRGVTAAKALPGRSPNGVMPMDSTIATKCRVNNEWF